MALLGRGDRQAPELFGVRPAKDSEVRHPSIRPAGQAGGQAQDPPPSGEPCGTGKPEPEKLPESKKPKKSKAVLPRLQRDAHEKREAKLGGRAV